MKFVLSSSLLLFVFVAVQVQITFRVEDDIYSPDFSVKIGNEVNYPDLIIKINKSGTDDYVGYTEKEFISIRDLVKALLPAINYHTDFKHDELNEQFEDLE